MANYKVSDTDLTSVASAIRTKGGTSASLSFPDGFISAIGDIPTGGGSTLITKSITENGTYNASSDNADGYSSVSVSVPVLFTKVASYTVPISWESGQTGTSMLTAAMEGNYVQNSMAYVLIFTNNESTSSYRCDAIIVSKLSSSSDISGSSSFMYRNHFGHTASLGSDGKATQGTVIDIYVATIPT